MFHLNISHEPEKPRRGGLFIAKTLKKIKLRRSDLFWGMLYRHKAAHDEQANENERTHLLTHPIVNHVVYEKNHPLDREKTL
jgi:hypothetical protein